jgi:hypothetical protein
MITQEVESEGKHMPMPTHWVVHPEQMYISKNLLYLSPFAQDNFFPKNAQIRHNIKFLSQILFNQLLVLDTAHDFVFCYFPFSHSVELKLATKMKRKCNKIKII